MLAAPCPMASSTTNATFGSRPTLRYLADRSIPNPPMSTVPSSALYR